MATYRASLSPPPKRGIARAKDRNYPCLCGILETAVALRRSREPLAWSLDRVRTRGDRIRKLDHLDQSYRRGVERAPNPGRCGVRIQGCVDVLQENSPAIYRGSHICCYLHCRDHYEISKEKPTKIPHTPRKRP